MGKKDKKQNRKVNRAVDNNPSVRLVRVDTNKKADNSIYHANMQALKIHYPELAIKIERTSRKDRFVISKVGSHATFNLYSRESNFYYYNDNPMEDVSTQIKALNLKNARLAIFLGMGLGYELMYYVQNESKKQNTSYILVIEKDLEIFRAAIENFDLTGFITHPQFKLIVGQEEGIYIPVSGASNENNVIFIKSTKIYISSIIPAFKQRLLYKSNTVS